MKYVYIYTCYLVQQGLYISEPFTRYKWLLDGQINKLTRWYTVHAVTRIPSLAGIE